MRLKGTGRYQESLETFDGLHFAKEKVDILLEYGSINGPVGRLHFGQFAGRLKFLVSGFCLVKVSWAEAVQGHHPDSLSFGVANQVLSVFVIGAIKV